MAIATIQIIQSLLCLTADENGNAKRLPTESARKSETNNLFS
jgi:hypothetical protein